MNRDEFEKMFLSDASAMQVWAREHGKVFAVLVSFVVGFIVGAIVL